MKKYLYLSGKAIILVFASAIVGLLLLLLVFSIPTNRIEQNVKDSVEIFETEGSYPTRKFLGEADYLDNYTDAIMLMNAAYFEDTGLIDRAISIYRPYISGENPAQTIVSYYSGEEADAIWPYARYWHGYLVMLKPLLTVLTYRQIRILNGILVTALGIFLIFVMYIKKMFRYILPYLIALLLINPLAISQSMQFTAVYYIYNISSIIFLFKKEWFQEHEGALILYFVLIGCATSYFDFLTYPLVTFGIPATLYLCSSSKSPGQTAKSLLLTLIFWFVGYAGMWAGKWLIGVIFGNQYIISNVASKLSSLSSMADNSGNSFSLIYLIKRQLDHFKTPVFVAAIIFLAVTGAYYVFHHPIKKIQNFTWILHIAICILPFVWFIVVSNHSYIHHWMTYRELLITAFSGLCLFARYATRSEEIA